MVAAATNRQRVAVHLLDRARPQTPLGHAEWAERYVRHASGPYRGQAFKCERQPLSRLLFDELDRRDFNTFLITGPSQSGKTLNALVIPTLRCTHSAREDAILGIPEADMADDKWTKDFLPTLQASPELSYLVPTKGPGSRGGAVRDRVSLGNGVDLKIMTRGGQDTAKAGYTSPNVFVTEAAGWSAASQTSAEADPLRQLKARQRAFKRSRRFLVVEGTCTLEDELPWRERGSDDDELLISSRSWIATPCPHCEVWIAPEREHLVGWQEATSEQQAADQACFVCPACGQNIYDDDRRAVNNECRLVHYGQSIDERGNLVGDRPETTQLWFRWSQFQNCLLDAGDAAAEEWRAAQIADGTVDRENAEKELCQFIWCTPYKSALTDADPLDAKVVRRRRTDWAKNLLPYDTEKLTIGVDLGKWTAWWLAMAHRKYGQRQVVSYGNFDVCRDDADEIEDRIEQSLREFADQVVEEGFPVEGSDGLLIPDLVWIDGGWMPEAVAAFVRSRGTFRENRYRLARGRGSSSSHQHLRTIYHQPKKASLSQPRVGHNWYAETNHKRRLLEFTFNADYWKLSIHEGLRAKSDARGAITLYRPDSKNEHAKISNHFCNEQYLKEWQLEKGLVEKWIRRGDNHWLDCAAMAAASGAASGFVPSDRPEDLEVDQVAADEASPRNWWEEALAA